MSYAFVTKTHLDSSKPMKHRFLNRSVQLLLGELQTPILDQIVSTRIEEVKSVTYSDQDAW